MTDALREAATKALEAFDGCAPMREVPMIVEALRAALAAPQAEPINDLVMVPRELIDRFPEINPSNYDHDDACELNAWGCEVVTNAVPPPRAAVPQAEQAEPVAWMYQHDETGRTLITEQPPDRVEPNDLRRWHIVSALYAAPPTRTPLTDEEMFNVIAREVGDDDLTSAIAAGRAVERAHGIVGGGK